MRIHHNCICYSDMIGRNNLNSEDFLWIVSFTYYSFRHRRSAEQSYQFGLHSAHFRQEHLTRHLRSKAARGGAWSGLSSDCTLLKVTNHFSDHNKPMACIMTRVIRFGVGVWCVISQTLCLASDAKCRVTMHGHLLTSHEIYLPFGPCLFQ